MGNSHPEYSLLMQTFYSDTTRSLWGGLVTPDNCLAIYHNPERMHQVFKADSFQIDKFKVIMSFYESVIQ